MLKSTLNKKAETELAFRRASALGNIETLKKMPFDDININAVGESSKKSAAHLASEHGNTEILKLLINLGIDLDIKDKDGKKASELAKNSETKGVFQCVDLARDSICAAQAFYPIIDAYAISKDQSSFFFQQVDSALKKHLFTLKDVWQEHLFKTHDEWVKHNNPDSDTSQDVLEKSKDNYRYAATHLFGYLHALYILRQANKDNKKTANCAEASYVSFTYLISYFDKIGLPVEIARYSDEAETAYHTYVILNRKQTSDIKRPETWGNDALIIDPDNNRVYFIHYVGYYHKYTDFKHFHELESKNVLTHSNVRPEFSQSNFDISLYEKHMYTVKQSLIEELKKRGIECPEPLCPVNLSSSWAPRKG